MWAEIEHRWSFSQDTALAFLHGSSFDRPAALSGSDSDKSTGNGASAQIYLARDTIMRYIMYQPRASPM